MDKIRTYLPIVGTCIAVLGAMLLVVSTSLESRADDALTPMTLHDGPASHEELTSPMGGFGEAISMMYYPTGE